MPAATCPRCATSVQFAAGHSPVCWNCGHGAPPAQGAPGAHQQWIPVGPASGPAASARAPPSEGVAIAALLINILVLPGVGTMVGGRIGEGVAQLLLFLLGLVLIIILVGFFLMFAIWIWGIVSGVQILQEAQRARARVPMQPAWQ